MQHFRDAMLTNEEMFQKANEDVIARNGEKSNLVQRSRNK